MQHLEVSGAVRPLKSWLGIKCLIKFENFSQISRISVHWEWSCFMWTEELTDKYDEANSRLSKYL